MTTKLVLLGTGTPNAEPDRWGAAAAVVAGGHAHIVDAGAGVVRRAAAASAKHGLVELEAKKLSRLYLTHLHSDHTVGLPDLLLSPWTLGRAEPLQIVGPPGSRRLVERVADAYAEDVRIRIEGEEPCNHSGWRFKVIETEGGAVPAAPGVDATAFAVRHGSCPHALGYRFESEGRVIVISGDTAPCFAVEEHARGADVLLHEVYSAARLAERPPEWQRYHRAFHTSGLELAALAARARPQQLVLTHQLLWGASEDEILSEIREGFDGTVVFGHDLEVF